MREKIVVGLSGGVDSSVTAYLLQEQGYEVIGVFMQNWEDDNTDEYCSIKEDSMDAIAVADLLGIDIELVNFAKEYKDRVFSYFLAEYSAGRTPNPDILCNSEIKFKCFLDYAMKLGGVKMATGHYADNRLRADGRTELLRGHDQNKDQSYFLYRLSQEQISHAVFPLGQIDKPEVRRIAEKIGLPNAKKKDSTGICFIGERPFREFLMRYLPTKPGEIRALDDDRVLGEHQGLMYHTIGQRKGLHIGGIKGNQDEAGEHDAWYVAQKDVATNVLYVVQGHAHPALLRERLVAADLNWVAGRDPHTNWVYTAKPRYRTPDMACQIDRLADGKAEIVFAQPQWAVTPGQSVVVYESTVCLGGGIIL